MTGPNAKVAGAELMSAIVAALGLVVAGGSRLVGWIVYRTKTTDELAKHQQDVMARFDRLDRWCARVDAFMASSTEHRVADERFMARTDVALNSLAQRIGRVERVQDHAA